MRQWKEQRRGHRIEHHGERDADRDQRPAGRRQIAQAPGPRSQNDGGREQQAIAEEGEAPGQGQGLWPELERIAQRLRALGRQSGQPEFRRQTGVEERADEQRRRS